MKRTLLPARRMGGAIRVPGDKSIAHRSALLSLISKGPVRIRSFPDNDDCKRSLEAARLLGVQTEGSGDTLVLTPPKSLSAGSDTVIDCGNSGTTARLLSGILAGSSIEITLTGDNSLRTRPMSRVIDPLSQMGAEFFADNGHLPMRIRGHRLSPLVYELPIASAQVKSALLLAGLASSCDVTIREKTVTRDHTERMIQALGGEISVREVKPVPEPDPHDPRRKRMRMPEPFRKEIILHSATPISGGEVDIPGDLSTAAFFLAAAALLGQSLTIENLGLNPTRTAFLDHLKTIGCQVDITNKQVISGEPRGTVTVTGAPLRARKLSGDIIVGLIDEIPIVSVLAASAEGTTIIRDASELRYKESDRLAAIQHNLQLMGAKCGLLEDGLVIEGGRELSGADFRSFGDHRIAMAFSIAALGLTGPSTVDDDAVTAVSCPEFYDLLSSVVS
ncbi:MAG: 3-phosphoshikimate 1-carboxyvinyltransferase [Candidatus Zixiibacteriota bacterium]